MIVSHFLNCLLPVFSTEMEDHATNITVEPLVTNEAWKEEAEDEWDELHPRRLIPELCKQFYHLGW